MTRIHPVPPGCPPESIVLTFPVPREQAGARLDRFIQRCIPRLSRMRAQEIIRACAYRADGRRRRPSDRVQFGETVLLVRPRFEEPDTPTTFDVVHDDEALYAIDKPAGLPVHPSATYHRNTVTWILRQRFGEASPRLAHRLDRETSGVLLCARTVEDERVLKRAFEQREIRKTYVAIVRGVVNEDEGVIDLPIAPAKHGLHLLMEVSQASDAPPARTRFRVRHRAGEFTLIELSPLTGRQHQLRVHLSAIGHAIVGDKLYGPEGAAPFIECIETGLTSSLLERLLHPRQALHAESLELKHPRSAAVVEVRAPIAPDMLKLWSVISRAADERAVAAGPNNVERQRRPGFEVETV